MSTLNEKIQQKIQTQIKENPIILYMKGTPDFPQCGFSQQVVHILKQLNCQFCAINVLADDDIREGIKIFSQWPTIPQLYVNEEFIGGCDIIKELNSNGELQKVLQTCT